MKRDRIFQMSKSELEALSTKQLLARLKRLHQCEESLAFSDKEGSDNSKYIEFKQSAEWITAYEQVKQVLSGREHVQKGVELVQKRTAKANSDRSSNRKAGRYVSAQRF